MYQFDEVRVEPVLRMRDGRTWMIATDDLALTFQVGGRPVVGMTLLAVPRTIARSRWWARAVNPIARSAMHGIRTRGRTSDGRREWYCAQDLRHVVSADARLDGVDLGELRPVDPPVTFGFSSVPVRPSLVRVLTQIAD
jgi:hypothetical protein